MTSSSGAGNRILGILLSADGKGVVRMQDCFDTDIDDLWSALTDPSRLARWMAEVEGDLRLGGEFRARFFASGWEGTGRVEACEPPRHLLLLTRQEPDQPYEHVIELTLTGDGDQTILVWEERGMPLEQLGAYGAGIQVHVEDLSKPIFFADKLGFPDGITWRDSDYAPAYRQARNRSAHSRLSCGTHRDRNNDHRQRDRDSPVRCYAGRSQP